MCLRRSSQMTNLLMLLHIVLQVYQIEINKVILKLKCVNKEIEKQKGYKASLKKLLGNKKDLRSAVNASVRALDQLIFPTWILTIIFLISVTLTQSTTKTVTRKMLDESMSRVCVVMIE